MEKMEIIDEQHRIYAIDYKLLEQGHLPSELTYISSDKNNVYLHCKGMKVAITNKTPCLWYFSYTVNNNQNLAHINPESVELLTIPEYIHKTTELQDNSCLYWLPHVSQGIEFTNKIMYDNKIKYSYNFDYLYWDCETASLNGEMANAKNPTSFICMIQMLHVVCDHITGLPLSYNYSLLILEWYREQFNSDIIKKEYPKIKIVFLPTSQLLAINFLLKLQSIDRHTMLIGFNASSSLIKTLTNPEYKALRTNKYFHAIKHTINPGFDWEMIMRESGQASSIHMKKSTKQVKTNFYC